jgi:hypothetical protein
VVQGLKDGFLDMTPTQNFGNAKNSTINTRYYGEKNMRQWTLIVSLFVLLVGISTISAQDMPNWCDAPDGAWYYGDGLSKCNTQPDAWSNGFMWVAGYYGALYDAEEITLEELFAINPAIAGQIIELRLPQLLITSESGGGGSVSLGGCYVMVTQVNVGTLGVAGSVSFFGTSPNIGFQYYDDTACQTPLGGPRGLDGFTAANQSAADAYCQTLFGPGGVAEQPGFSYTTSPTAPIYWKCT